MFDYHIHTTFSDGKLTPEEIIKKAIEMNFSSVGISDHFTCPPDFPPPPFYLFGEKMDNYFAEVNRLKEKYKDQIDIAVSCETDYYRESWDKTLAIVKKYSPDYIFGTVHEVYGEEHLNYWHLGDKIKDFKYLGRFLEAEIELVRTGQIDLLAHCDLYLQFAEFDYRDFYDYSRELAKACEETGTAVEINTRNGRRGQIDNDPEHFMIKEFIRRNVPIVLSSDTHDSEIAYCFRENFEILKSLGMKWTCRFREGKIIREPFLQEV